MASTRGIRAGRAFVELFADDSRLVRGLRRAEKKLKAFGASVRNLGLKVTALGAAAAAPFVLSARTFAGFEQQMARVRALTGASEKDFQRLSDAAKRLGETTVFSASQAAEAMSFFALAGFGVDQILGAIGPALDLAAAGQIEIAQAADIAAKIMAGMGLSAGELGRAVDVLTKAMTTANTDLGQLGDAMKFVGPVAKSAGRGLEEIVAAIQLLSNAGIQGEMAGTTLRGVLLTLTSPSKEAADELARLGVRVLDAQGDVRSLADIIDDVNRGLAGLGGGERLGAIGRIFDARQAAGFAELLAQGGDRLREFTAALGDSQGVAQKIADIQLDTLTGDVTILRSALEGLRIAIGEALVESLRKTTRIITRAVGGIAQWARQNQQVVVSAAKIVALVLAGGAALVVLGTLISGLGAVLGGLATILATAGAALGVMGTALGALLSPVGLVVAAIVALGTTLLTMSGAASEGLDLLTDRIKSLAAPVLETLGVIADAVMAGEIDAAFEVLWASVKLIWQKGLSTLTGAWLDFKTGFLKLASDAFFGMVKIAVNALDAVRSAFTIATGFLAKQFLKLQGLFDETLDVQGAIDLVDQETQGRLASIGEKNLKSIADIESTTEAARALLDSEAEANRAESEAELAKARAAFDKAVADARAASVGGPDSEGSGGGGVADRIRQLIDSLGSADSGVGQQLRNAAAVRGTFNAAAIQGLMTDGGVAERTAKATEDTARNTKRIERAINDNAIAFA